MRTLPVFVLFWLVHGDHHSYSSFSSSSFSSYSNLDGKEQTETRAEERFSEKDSSGTDRSGEGKLVTRNGKQVLESLENCDGGRCVASVDKTMHSIPRKFRRIIKRVEY